LNQAGALRRFLTPLLVMLALAGDRRARAADRPASAEDESPPAPAPRKPARLGEWIDSGALRFEVDAITSCGTTGASATRGPGSAPKPGAGPTQASPAIVGRPPSTLLAFWIRVVAGAGEVFVSPRDVTLEAGGVILQAAAVSAPLAQRCTPALTARRLPSRQHARGSVIFEISPEFRASPAPITLAYRPTRWGGAGRLEVAIPRCLEACKERDRVQ
jgi:hypothetical protein